MRLTVFAATLAFLLWGTPAFAGSAPDFDGDGISDGLDNCSDDPNDDLDDTDADGCGNICDADYDQDGAIGFFDFGEFLLEFGSTNEEFCHFQPVIPCNVGLNDFGYFLKAFSFPPGPSGVVSGTTACP